MDIKKRQRYKDNLYAAIHTLSIKCSDADEVVAGLETIVKSCSKKKVRHQDYYEYYLMLNPNKAVGAETMIKSYSRFEEVLRQALNNIGISNFRITRADFCFNSDESEDYELFKKLNKLLICCIADAENIRNCYQTADLWSNKSLSVAVKNDVIEAENYNKELQSQGTTETKNRLEFRSKRVKKTLDKEFQDKWFLRLDKAYERFEAVQERYNRELCRIWEADVEQPEKERNFISVDAFLMTFRDCIFTRKQLVDLLSKMGVKNPQTKAKKFKDKHKVEFFSKKDLKEIIKALKEVARKYFEK